MAPLTTSTVRLAVFLVSLAAGLVVPGQAGGSVALADIASAGGFTTSATVTPASIPAGNATSITASVSSNAAITALVDVEVYAPTGVKILQQVYDNQTFGPGEQRSFPVNWTSTPTSAAGVYTVRMGIFTPGWGTLYHWNHSAALFSVASAEPSPTPGPGGTPVRVMPLGDSLTDGYNIPGGYRTELWPKFVAGGLTIDFVGSLVNGPASLPDQQHEGHSGWRIDQIAGSIVTWLTAYRPDIVLLMIGTNDMVQDFDVAAAPARLSALIDQITTTTPAARIIVASIPRMGGSPYIERIQAYNATIPGIVSAQAGQGKSVTFVDMFAAITPSDLHTDFTHMAASGNAKMADVWYPAIRTIAGGGTPPPPTPTPPATPSPTATPSPVPTATPSILIAPSNARAGTTTTTSIQVLWDDNSTNETSFQVSYRQTSASTWTTVRVGANVTAATLGALRPVTAHYVRVRACNAVSCSPWSNRPTISTG